MFSRWGRILFGMLVVVGVFSGPVAGQSLGAGGADMQAVRAEQQQKTKAFLDAELKEGQEFMASIAGKPKGEKIVAIRAFKTAQYEKNCAFREERYQERKVFLQGRSGQAGGMNAVMKEKMIDRLEADYREVKEFFAGKHQENMTFLDGVLANVALDGAALDQALQEFFQEQKKSAQQFMQTKKSFGGGMNRR
ncbi:MAG TPA: hypothetical protein PKO06_06970 [Candidatus Ozemobacteraceae bacterium]|mgnify:CR=1 FL=1|nr:hypothetical protein [Candidatus Ozemobacteraceae bacterium]